MTSQSIALEHSTLSSFKSGTNSALPSDSDTPERTNDKDIELSSDQNTSASLRLGVLIHRSNAGFAARANTLQSFLELNRRVNIISRILLSQRLIMSLLQFLKGVTYSPPSDPQKRLLIHQTAKISPNSIIGESTQIDERASIKDSIVGRHCVLGKMVKIVRCVILDHCVIGDG